MPSWHAYWDYLNGREAILSDGHRTNPRMRFKFENRFFRIMGVIDVDEQHKWYEFACEEMA
jgi:hypothetical protein